MGWLFGVDEAGRGPVLGSMFVAGVAIEDPDALPDGVRDSKELSPTRRERLAEALEVDPAVAVAIHEITAAEIDDEPGALNELTRRGHRAVIDALHKRCPGARCIVDACDVDADRWGRLLETDLPDGISVEARHGADADEPIVSAASILAKQRREDHVAALAATHGSVGSGYPSDQTTRSFIAAHIERHGSLPPCARTSWQTCADLLAAAEQSSLNDTHDRS